MTHKRFERSDVVASSPLVHVLGLIVVVAVFVGVVFVINKVWDRVKTEDRLDDATLQSALKAQSDTILPEGYYMPSADNHETVLILTLNEESLADESAFDAAKAFFSKLKAKFFSGSDEEAAEDEATAEPEAVVLGAVSILDLDLSTGTGASADISVDVKLNYNDTDYTLADFVAEQGYAALIGPLSSATGISVDHVIASSDVGVLEAIEGISGVAADELVAKAPELLKSLRTDMDPDEFAAFALSLSSVGVSRLSVVSEASYPESYTTEEGITNETGYYLVNKTHTLLSLGLVDEYQIEEVSE